MTKDYIDVEYTEVDQKPVSQGEVTINADPLSAAISGFASVVNNVTSSIKEYNMCRQQEETRRAEIRANMKIEIARIDAQKELILKKMSQEHEIKLEMLRNNHEYMMKQLDTLIDVIHTAIGQARETGDFSSVLSFLDFSQKMIQTRNEFTLQYIEKNCIAGIQENTGPKGYLA